MARKSFKTYILFVSLFPICIVSDCSTSSSVKLLSPKSCQQYRTDSIDDLISSNSSSSPWCMFIKLEDFSFTGPADCRQAEVASELLLPLSQLLISDLYVCSNGVGTSETLELWDLCQKLMQGKSDNESCFEMNNAKYRSEKTSRNYQMKKITIYCCRNKDECNSKESFDKSELVCAQLKVNWPPLPILAGSRGCSDSNFSLSKRTIYFLLLTHFLSFICYLLL